MWVDAQRALQYLITVNTQPWDEARRCSRGLATNSAAGSAAPAIWADWAARKRRHAWPMVHRQLAEMVHGGASWCTPRVGAWAERGAGAPPDAARNISEMLRGVARRCAPL